LALGVEASWPPHSPSAASPFAACLMPPASGSCGCRQHPPRPPVACFVKITRGRTWKPLLCASSSGQPRISFPCPAESRAAGEGLDVLMVDGIMSWHAIRASSTMSSSTCHRSSRDSCAERVSIDRAIVRCRIGGFAFSTPYHGTGSACPWLPNRRELS